MEEIQDTSPHLIENAPRLTHSQLSVDLEYDEAIDAYDKTEFIEYLESRLESLKNSLPTRKGNYMAEIQICSNFFMECKNRFKGIEAIIIFDELTDYLGINPTNMYNNLAKPIKNQLRKELSKRISLDKYKIRERKEFIERNGAIQPTF